MKSFWLDLILYPDKHICVNNRTKNPRVELVEH